MRRLLLATDLDRTLLPNGAAPESPGARPCFAALAAHRDVTVVYVTGRDPGRVDEALQAWGVPRPDVLIADVGTTIADPGPGGWLRWPRWDVEIGRGWHGSTAGDLASLLADLPGLQLQEASRQSRWKLSFETRPASEVDRLGERIRVRLAECGVAAAVVGSRDDLLDKGLLDVLPPGADKQQALAFVMKELGFAPGETVFAGDSGNDLPVLAGPVPAVVVANADPGFQVEAAEAAARAGLGDRLVFARGGVLGMNGNYAAGIIEGVLHFRPEWRALLEGAS